MPKPAPESGPRPDDVSKLIPLLAEAGLHAVPNPLINIVLQGRHDTYPKRRGMTRVKELMAAGVNVSFGHDCVMDPWYSLGTHDMLEVASMGLYVGQMTALDEMPRMFDAVTVNGSRTLGLERYGLEKGSYADIVILQAADPVEALRLKPARLFVIRRGRIIAENGRPATIPLSLTKVAARWCRPERVCIVPCGRRRTLSCNGLACKGHADNASQNRASRREPG